jgi:hypothetical protein
MKHVLSIDDATTLDLLGEVADRLASTDKAGHREIARVLVGGDDDSPLQRWWRSQLRQLIEKAPA